MSRKTDLLYIIGDTQSKEGVRNPLIAIAHHICDVKPSHVIHLGDAWDMPSLSYFDKGKRKHVINACYLKDMEAGNKAMREFWAIISKRWPTFKDDCVFVFLFGNHEQRRDKALDYCEYQYIELIKSVDFDLTNWNIKVPFLEIAKIHGIEFSHYFSNSGSPHPIGTARQLLNKRHVSCIAGHKQGFDYAEMLQGRDKTIQAVILGSSYYHDEEYKNHNNHHFRGTLLLHNVDNPNGFDFARFSMETLDKFMEKHK